jgi:hypothetical protein
VRLRKDRGVFQGREAISSGEGSGTTAADESPSSFEEKTEEEEQVLETQLEGTEVRVWATRVSSRGDGLDTPK